jgi:SsrA-binding protein
MSERAKETLIAENRKARHDYFIEDTLEAGLVLMGTEIKSIRAGRVNLQDAYARIEGDEAWVYNLHVSPYSQAGGYFNHEPLRKRKLLLHRSEIRNLAMKTQAKGLTIVPLKLYIKGNKAKILLGLAKGKREYDKRDAIAERDAKLEIARTLRAR